MSFSIGIVGCAGRMGRMLIETVIAADGATLSGGTEAPGSPHLGTDLARLVGGDLSGLVVTDDVDALFAASDAVIDFTVPAATRVHAQAAAKTGTIHIVGTTGLSDTDHQLVDDAAKSIAILQAPKLARLLSM